jgi:hypothetical protein
MGIGKELHADLQSERGRELTKQGELRYSVPEAAASRACTGAGETERRPADTYMHAGCTAGQQQPLNKLK